MSYLVTATCSAYLSGYVSPKKTSGDSNGVIPYSIKIYALFSFALWQTRWPPMKASYSEGRAPKLWNKVDRMYKFKQIGKRSDLSTFLKMNTTTDTITCQLS